MKVMVRDAYFCSRIFATHFLQACLLKFFVCCLVPLHLEAMRLQHSHEVRGVLPLLELAGNYRWGAGGAGGDVPRLSSAGVGWIG